MRNILFTCLNRSFRTPGIVWLSSLQQLNDQTNFLEDTEVWVFHTPDFNKSGYEKFTFVRWYELPVVDNIKYCQENKVFCDVHFTASKLNAPEFPEFVEWLVKEGLYDYPYFSINTASVDYPKEFKVNQLPEEEKIKAIEKLGAFKESFTGLFSFTDKQKEEIVKCCDGIIASLEE